jgi:hypothetical protein
MKNKGASGKVDVAWSDERELPGGFTETIEIFGVCEYHVTPGDPGCRYTRNGDGWPPSPPEFEYFNFVGTRLVVAIWKDDEKQGRITLYEYDGPPATPETAKIWGEWLGDIASKDFYILGNLDVKVSEMEYAAWSPRRPLPPED